MGLEPTKTGFAGQRLEHFGIITSVPIKVFVGCPKISGLYPNAVQKIARNTGLDLKPHYEPNHQLDWGEPPRFFAL